MGLLLGCKYFWLMKRFVKRLLTFILFIALSGVQKFSAPAVLPKDQMIAILLDLELAKAMVQYYSDDEVTFYHWFEENSSLIYQAHATEPILFQNSYQYYLAHPKVMQEIYESVIDRLEELLEQVKEDYEKPR